VEGAARARRVPNRAADYRDYYRAVRRAIKEGGANPVTPEEALNVMRILEAACTSAAERRAVALG